MRHPGESGRIGVAAGSRTGPGVDKPGRWPPVEFGGAQEVCGT